MWCVRINIFSWFGVNWENVDSLHVHTGRQFSPPVYLLRVSSRPRHDKLTRNQIWPSRRRQGIEVVYKCIPPARNFQLSPWLDWEKKMARVEGWRHKWFRRYKRKTGVVSHIRRKTGNKSNACCTGQVHDCTACCSSCQCANSVQKLSATDRIKKLITKKLAFAQQNEVFAVHTQLVRRVHLCSPSHRAARTHTLW